MRFTKYTPYVRRANGREKSSDFRTALRLAFYASGGFGFPYYVMVQHGFPDDAMIVGRSKREVQGDVLQVAFKMQTFNDWSKQFGKVNRKKKSGRSKRR